MIKLFAPQKTYQEWTLSRTLYIVMLTEFFLPLRRAKTHAHHVQETPM